MKNQLLLFYFFVTVSIPYKAQVTKVLDGPKIEFISDIYDYGVIKKGCNGYGYFILKNTGNKPLFIKKINTHTGALVGDWPKDSIYPGKTDTIICCYYTARIGKINKSMHVKSNAINDPIKELKIKGIISTDTINGPVIKYARSIYNYGAIKKGGDGSGYFVIKNIGNEPLIIIKVQSSCGCLVPNWPRKSIAPGNTDTIRCQYATNRVGPFYKSLTVYSNAINNKQKLLRIKGEVFEKFIELEKYNFEIDAGTITYNASKEFSFILEGIDTSIVNPFLAGDNSSQIFFKIPKTDIYHPDIKISKTINDGLKKTITLSLRNIHGNIGKFKKTLYFEVNNKKKIQLTITGNYISAPKKKIINGYAFYASSNAEYKYEKGMLTNIIFKNKTTNKIETECFYAKGILLESKHHTYYDNKHKVTSYKIDDNKKLDDSKKTIEY